MFVAPLLSHLSRSQSYCRSVYFNSPSLPCASRLPRPSKRSVALAAASAASEPEPTTVFDEEAVAQEQKKNPQFGGFSLRFNLYGRLVRIPIGFTKTNELLIGRLAMFSLSAALIQETITGKGPLGELGFHIGVSSIFELDKAILFLIAFNFVAALLPARGRFVPDKGAKRWPEQDPKVALLNPKYIRSSSEAGLTKEDELSLGRLCQLGLSLALISEAMTGKGALAQMEIDTGLPACETEPLIIIFVAMILLAAINPGSGKFVGED